MTRETLNNIFLQIVKDMAYNPGYQIDTYRLNDTNPDLAHSSFGSTYQDYVDGQFWSRSFYHAGADRNAFCGRYPVLMAEIKDVKIECLDDEKMRVEMVFVVVDRIKCEACPPHITRSGVAVSMSVLAILRSFLNELYGYKYYEVDRIGTITFEWMSEGRKDYEEGLGNTLIEMDNIASMIDPNSILFNEWGNDIDKRGWITEVAFELCEPIESTFEYNNPVVPGLANTECATC